MFRSIISLLGLGNQESTHEADRLRFSPRLESLDGRAMPSTLAGWEGIEVGVGVVRGGAELPPSPVPAGGKAGGVVGSYNSAVGTRPVTPTDGAMGGIILKGHAAPGELTVARNAGEEIPS